ncbi:MAG: hypothetical protein ACJA0I_001443 [Gammaproteobacteria bacterium]|jgi:hypothetical protein
MVRKYEFDDDSEANYAEDEHFEERFPSSDKKKRNSFRRQIDLLMEKKRLRSMMDTSDSYWDED